VSLHSDAPSPTRLHTVICDGSWLDQHEVGGWAYYWRSEGVKEEDAGGVRPPYVGSSTDAEYAAAAAGLAAVAEVARAGDTVLLQTDCMAVVHAAKGGPPRPLTIAHQMCLAAMDCVRRRGAVIRIRHVPAHTGTATARTWAHDRCDRAARAAARREALRPPPIIVP
jgi:ribonuclease HI